MPKHLPLAALGTLFALTFAVAAVADPYVEDFTTTTFKDALTRPPTGTPRPVS